MKIYELKLKNKNQKTMLIDDASYQYFSEDSILKEMKVLENLREHASSGAAVYQKWFRDIQNKPYLETIYVHKAIAEKFIPKPSDAHVYVVHINGDRLDNRTENLRWCTSSERNLYTSRYHTGYRGVRKEKDKYLAIIHINHKPVQLGIFDTVEEAHRVYQEASVEQKSALKEKRQAKKALLKTKTTRNKK